MRIETKRALYPQPSGLHKLTLRRLLELPFRFRNQVVKMEVEGIFYPLSALANKVKCLQVKQILSRALSLGTKFEQGGEARDIDEAITLDRVALELCPPGHPLRATAMGIFAFHLSSLYHLLGKVEILDEVIFLARGTLALNPPGHPERSMSLNNLANYLVKRFKHLGRKEDLEEAIDLAREVLALRPMGHSLRSRAMNNLSNHLCTRYEEFGGVGYLKEAIVLAEGALAITLPGHPERSSSLRALANYLFKQHELFGRVEGLDKAIALVREALVLCPPGHPDRSFSLNNLASYLCTRYKKLGKIKDLDEAIVLAQGVLALHPRGHMERSTYLSNLAVYLCTRYTQLGRVEDLEEAILLDQDALILCPLGNRDRSMSLNNLASHLRARYELLGKIEDLEEAIVLGREAVALRPPGHPDRPSSLSNLAGYLSSRYQLLGGLDDLDEAIALARDAVTLHQPGHSGRSTSLNNLALYLSNRYEAHGGVGDLEEAIALGRDALILCPQGNQDRSMCLNSLVLFLSARYEQLGRVEDLEEAIILCRETMMLNAPGHKDRSSSLNNLAVQLSTRYRQFGGIEDLEEAILLYRDILALCPPGHPNRSGALNNLASCLANRYKEQGEAKDQEELFSLYRELEHVSQSVSPADLPAAKTWVNAAEYFHHPTTVLAYETALRLIVHRLATVPSLPRHLTVFKSFVSSLAVDGFSACLRNQFPTNAVVLLEQGRAVFWSQLTRLRSPLHDVMASGPTGKALGDEFTRLASLIRNALSSPGVDQHDRVCHLNSELQKLVSSIRRLPGLSRFLLPLPFSDLRIAARDGPVIIMNSSKYGCDALVVFFDQDPVHIPLAITKDGVRTLSSRLRTLTKLAMTMDVTKDLCLFLRELWDEVVSPIANFLQTVWPCQSRIWWCPTAEFSLLPLHAATPFRKGQQSLSDIYISSYTPTLSALIRARQNTSNLVVGRKRFLGIGQAKASGEGELHAVGTELANIGQYMESLATFSCIEGQESTISRVGEELGNAQWVHFACHGIPNGKRPFESAFALLDGHFTIQHITQCYLRDPEFAYLSACRTTVGDNESPDEIIHLASAMQFSGFRSVIGTMWAVDDAETNKITSTFYTHMVDTAGRLDHTRAAFALWKTMRTVKVPLDQRILYVHIGA